MASYAMRVRTDRPADEVFAYLSDLTNFSEWDPGVTRAVQVEGSGPGPDAEFELDASGSTLRYVVETYEPPRTVVAVARNRFLTSIDTITVEPDGTGSVATYHADLVLNGIWKVGDPFLKLAFNRIGGKAADGLVAQLDGTRID